MVTDKMVDAALSAIEGKHIDARRFWTDEDRENMRTAITAAITIKRQPRNIPLLGSSKSE